MVEGEHGGASFALAAVVGDEEEVPREVCSRVAERIITRLKGRHYGAVDLFTVTIWFECDEVPLEAGERGVFGVDLDRSQGAVGCQVAVTRSEWANLPAASLASILTARIRECFQAFAEHPCRGH